MAKKDYYKILEIDKKATKNDVESAYAELVDIYGHKSQSTYSLFEDDERETLLEDIREAYDTLSNDLKRRQYDENVYILSNYKPNKDIERADDKKKVSQKTFIKDPKDSVFDLIGAHSGKVIDGNFMIELRKKAELSIKDICLLSNMNSNVVEMLEGNDFVKLPGRTYVLGFAKLYFRIFADDYERFAKAYIENYDTFMIKRK